MPRSTSDESLAEPTPDAEVDEAYGAPSLAAEAVTGSADLNPKAFDVADWLAGVQPVRRSHTMHARADLVAQVDELAALEMVTHASQRAPIVAEAVELTEQIKASGITFVVEGKTATWETAFRKTLDEAGIKDNVERSLRQMAAQVVEPTVTYDDLAFLAEHREAELARMLDLMTEANHRPVGLNPRFLRGASD